MPWLRLIFETSPEEATRLAGLLEEAGACAVTMEDAGDQPIYEPPPDAVPLWHGTRVTGLFAADTDLAAVRARLVRAAGERVLSGWHVDLLEDREWTRAWMDGFRPMRFGKRLWVVPHQYEAPDPGAVNLRLDPGLAFGTGTHPTTALCLEWLDAHPPQAHTIIDYGCGSGILAIAALLLGARHAWAVDNDPQALTATRRNAEDNGVAARLSAVAPRDLPALEADLVLANILAGPLVALAPELAARVRTGGTIVLSGILAGHEREVKEAYLPWFEFSPCQAREGWIRLEGVRRTRA